MSFETTLFQNFLNQLSYSSEIDLMILCGSYALGTATETSDIDLRIILSNTSTISERRIKTLEGYQFSYATHTKRNYKKLIEQQFANGSKFEARLLATGTIIYQKPDSDVAIKNFAAKIIETPFKKLSQYELNRVRYGLRNQYEKVMKLSKESSFFSYNYFCFLKNTLQTYTNILGTEYILEDKLEAYFYSEEFRKLHQMQNIDDEFFKSFFKQAIQEVKKTNLKQLYEHLETKIGTISLEDFTF
ncbi:nucleotidyltransferase domain-containing protein [Kordia sp. YSTF-M3]|uniref:Nucleotidyltransferase domain-containing protein n=1 Tax=Kordia aestuariivivens TaxID=2759037 RepID=A0ABR7QEP0_9FLAO|nr:nucleotidyltransferase domain-containing protein [Kordia aestuariivivens]MBC8757030.1 nucleotidyltransferase domain-containing protein [Kordia aestuariivivens]